MFVPLRNDSYGSAESSGATTASSAQPPTPDDVVAPQLPLKGEGDAIAFVQLSTRSNDAQFQAAPQFLQSEEEQSSEDEQAEAHQSINITTGGPSSAPTEEAVRGLTRRGRPRKIFRYLQDVGGALLVPPTAAATTSGQPASASQTSKRKLSNESSKSKPSGLVVAIGSSVKCEQDDEETKNAKKLKVSKVTRACIFCKRSHMTCDDERPCKRCHKRGIAHMCGDEEAVAPAASSSRKGKDAAAAASAKGKESATSVKGKEASSAKGKEVSSSVSRARKSSFNRNKMSSSPSASHDARPRIESSLTNAFSHLASVGDRPPLHIREAAPPIPERVSSSKLPFSSSSGDGFLGASGLTPSMTHYNSSSTSALPEHPLSLPSSGAFSDALGGDAHDPGLLLSLTQLTPGGQIQIPTGELFWASFPSGGGVTPGMIGGGLTPFETFLKENQGTAAPPADGYTATEPTSHSGEHLSQHIQHQQLPLLTPLGMFRLADGSLQGLETLPAPLTHANVANNDYHAHAAPNHTALSHYPNGMQAGAPSYNMTPSTNPNVTSHPTVARWECPEHQRLKSWIEGPLPSAAWTPSLRGRLLHSLDMLKNVIQPRTAGLDGMAKHRQDVDFARVHTHYKHAVLESISAPILLVRRWGDVCDANSHLLNLLGLNPSHFNPPRAGLTDIFSAKLAVHLYERYALVMQEPHNNSLVIRATGLVQTALPPASGLRESPSIRCAISFQIVTDAQGLPLMGVATLLPVDSSPDL